ncbi:MAG: DUF262 domain-containing protein [Proteobacteria bacterium]|nr:MAG: DUF262 domain-containing protein [Pseudomonadota bacterium]
MDNDQTAAPSPAVEHLPTVLRKIRSGDYRVPAFQRDFIWEEKQVLDLMESVYRGFPIGSILLWRVDGPVFSSAKDEIVSFPKLPERYPTSFILDGVQRLAALNGAFSVKEEAGDPRFNLFFDLENQVFIHERDLKKSGVSLPLRSVFQPRSFLAEQQTLAKKESGDLFLERAVKVLAIFQEYMIPLVTIERKSAREVVDIFQRINSTGTRLGVVDFIRALTWSDDFDLNVQLNNLQSHFEEKGFLFEEETLLKSLGIVMDLKPLPNVLLSLRSKSAQELNTAVERLRKILDEVTRYVSEGLKIASSEALPYEAQWLFMVRLFHEEIDISDFRNEILCWFKTTSLFETLQGRPDHALARMIDEMAEAMKIPAWPIDRMNTLDPAALISKRFTRGKATSVAFVEMLLERGTFNLHGDQAPISAIPYENFFPILNRDELNNVSHRYLNSARTIPNVYYLPSGVAPKNSFGSIDFVDFYDSAGSSDIPVLFDRQFIDSVFVRHLKEGRLEEALMRRSEAIAKFRKCQDLIHSLSIFSPNETLDDISTTNLQFVSWRIAHGLTADELQISYHSLSRRRPDSQD